MPKTVLIVEDNENIVLGMRIALEARGYDVRVARDGVSAMEMAFESKPDLILLDLILPRLDGFAVLEGLKKDLSTHNIPVVVISAKAAEEDIRRARELGAQEYLVKPFDPSGLDDIISKIFIRNEKETHP